MGREVWQMRYGGRSRGELARRICDRKQVGRPLQELLGKDAFYA